MKLTPANRKIIEFMSSNLGRFVRGLFGVALFSLIMGQFIEMIVDIMESNSLDGDGDQLARFFGVL